MNGLSVDYIIMRIAKLLDEKDLKNYFRGSVWKKLMWKKDGSFEGETENLSFKFNIAKTQYKLHVEATDDPSDSLDITTTDPVKELTKFLGEGISGGGHFEQMASSPARLAAAIRHVASVGSPAHLVRRLYVASSIEFDSNKRVAVTLDDIELKLRLKKWEVKRDRDEFDRPTLTINVSGVYTAVISDEEKTWDYEFSVTGDPEVNESGNTDDPRIAFRNFSRSQRVEEAVEAVKAAKKLKLQEAMDQQTVKPGAR